MNWVRSMYESGKSITTKGRALPKQAAQQQYIQCAQGKFVSFENMDNDESTKTCAQFEKFRKLISLKNKKSSKDVNLKNSFTGVI